MHRSAFLPALLIPAAAVLFTGYAVTSPHSKESPMPKHRPKLPPTAVLRILRRFGLVAPAYQQPEVRTALQAVRP